MTAPARPRPATALVYARERRHSRNVRILKIALPLSAVLMVAAFVAYSALSSYFGDASVSIGSTAIADGKLVMTSPKLEGFTGDNKPYSMTAARALQDLTDSQRVDLETIKATMPFEANGWAKIDAASGVFDREANTLVINSPAVVRTHDGMVAKLEDVRVDISGGGIQTEKPVEIVKDGSRIAADSMSVSDGGNVIVFEKRVRMTIDPERMKQASAGSNKEAPDAAD